MTDTADVHTYIVKLTSGNAAVETKMVAHETEKNGRIDFMLLKDHYEGVGMHAVNVVQAEKVLNFCFIWVRRNHTFGGTSPRGS